jgi:hypothetical protein
MRGRIFVWKETDGLSYQTLINRAVQKKGCILLKQATAVLYPTLKVKKYNKITKRNNKKTAGCVAISDTSAVNKTEEKS